MRKPSTLLAITFAILGWCPGIAHAALVPLSFGKDDKIHRIQATNSGRYILCYRTTTFTVVLPWAFKDHGYVLQEGGDKDHYYQLDDEQIHALQSDGELPDPMPPYSVSFFDYLFGMAGWLVILVILAAVFGKSLLEKFVNYLIQRFRASGERLRPKKRRRKQRRPHVETSNSDELYEDLSVLEEGFKGEKGS